jgi:hypothetical protein
MPNFTVSLRFSIGLFEILKNTLELEQRTNRNLEFTQVDISLIDDVSPICFYLSRMGIDDISSEEHF